MGCRDTQPSMPYVGLHLHQTPTATQPLPSGTPTATASSLSAGRGTCQDPHLQERKRWFPEDTHLPEKSMCYWALTESSLLKTLLQNLSLGKKVSQEPHQVNECLVDHTNEDAVSACCSPTCLCQCQLQSMPCVPPCSLQPGAKQGGWCNMHTAKLGVSSSRGHSKLRKGDFHSVSLDRNQMQQHEDKVESEFLLFA